MAEQEFESQLEAYPVHLQNFEGPLDLLLHLIKTHEVNIYDIPIVRITTQYLEYLALMEVLDLDVVGEFLVMAATLIHIKSRMLLPRPDPTQDDPEEDPRDALVRRLLEHQKYKAAAELLHEKEIQRSAQWGRPDEVVAGVIGDAPEPEVEVDLFSLMAAFRQVLERAKQRPRVILPAEQMPIEVRMEQLLQRLSETEACGFEDLFEDAMTPAGVIVTFLALLEMIRLKLVRVFQPGGLGPIRVYKREALAGAPAFDRTRHAVSAMSDLKAIIEALIYASPEPVTIKALTKLLDTEPKEDIAAAIDALKADYERPGGLQVVDVAGGYQIVTRPELHEWVRRLFHERTTSKLSVAALETLAVIAYKQPVTAPEIAEIRGVNTAGVLGTLVDRRLVKVVGRKAIVGRPFMYGTTRDFLERFGLNDLTDLPKVEDMSELLGFDLPSNVAEPAPQTALPFEPIDALETDTPVPEEIAIIEVVTDADGEVTAVVEETIVLTDTDDPGEPVN